MISVFFKIYLISKIIAFQEYRLLTVDFTADASVQPEIDKAHGEETMELLCGSNQE